jgi:hypothetical protein
MCTATAPSRRSIRSFAANRQGIVVHLHGSFPKHLLRDSRGVADPAGHAHQASQQGDAEGVSRPDLEARHRHVHVGHQRRQVLRNSVRGRWSSGRTYQAVRAPRFSAAVRKARRPGGSSGPSPPARSLLAQFQDLFQGRQGFCSSRSSIEGLLPADAFIVRRFPVVTKPRSLPAAVGDPGAPARQRCSGCPHQGWVRGIPGGSPGTRWAVPAGRRAPPERGNRRLLLVVGTAGLAPEATGGRSLTGTCTARGPGPPPRDAR